MALPAAAERRETSALNKATTKIALIAATAIGLVGVLGNYLVGMIDSIGMGSPHHYTSSNIFYFLFVEYEQWMSILLILLSAVAGLFIYLSRSKPSIAMTAAPDRRLLPLVACFSGLIALVGTYTVCLNHPLAMDEFMTNFQARIFLHGKVYAPLGSWNEFGAALTPTLAIWDKVRGAWTANYLPVYAAMRAPFLAVGLETVLNPLLTLGSVWLVGLAARRIWPDDPWAPALAGIFLAVSPQFLITGMTAYSMPAHLFLNLLWLVLYLRDDRLGLGLAPWIGIASMNLHQPNIHAMFVAPFLVRMVLERRWGRSAYFAAVYSVGCAFFLFWMKLRAPLPSPGQVGDDLGQLKTILGFFTVIGTRNWVNTGMFISLTFLWQSWAMSFFALAGLREMRSLPKPIFDLLCGIIVSLLFYFFYGYGQGHGWGNRGFYPLLGGFSLLAVRGWKGLLDLPVRGQILAASLAITLLLEFPFRCFEVYRTTEPFAAADHYLHQFREPFVVVETLPIWYGQDLVRNQPFLTNNPKFFFAGTLRREQYDELVSRGATRVVRAPSLLELGLNQRQFLIRSP